MDESNKKKDRRYWIMQKIFIFVYRLLARVEIVNQENLYVKGPCLVVMNHLSVFDPPLIMTVFPRRAWTFAAEKYRRHLFSPVLNLIGVIYIKRGKVDRHALRAALKVLKEGGAVGLAPEGTRSKVGQLQQAKDGAAYLASRTGATIVLAAVTGTENMLSDLKRLRRGRIKVVIGEPFKLPSFQGVARGSLLATYTELIMCRLAALLPESYRGYYRHRCAPDGTPMPRGD